MKNFFYVGSVAFFGFIAFVTFVVVANIGLLISDAKSLTFCTFCVIAPPSDLRLISFTFSILSLFVSSVHSSDIVQVFLVETDHEVGDLMAFVAEAPSTFIFFLK